MFHINFNGGFSNLLVLDTKTQILENRNSLELKNKNTLKLRSLILNLTYQNNCKII